MRKRPRYIFHGRGKVIDGAKDSERCYLFHLADLDYSETRWPYWRVINPRDFWKHDKAAV